MLPPDDLITKQRTRHGKRNAFNVCALTFMVNRAALDYKKKYCPGGYNAQKCIRLITRHDRVPPHGSIQNPHSYAIAKLVCNTSRDDLITEEHKTAMRLVRLEE